MILLHDEGYQDMHHNRDDASSAEQRLSVSTGSRAKSPRVVGWRGETVEDFRLVDIDVNANEIVPSPLNSATSFRSGKMFWQKLLEEKNVPALSPSSGSESTYSDYAEIHLTGSSVSSITDHSGFRGMKSSLSVDIPTTDSLHSLSISSIDRKRNRSQDIGRHKLETDLSALSTEKNNQEMRKSGDGKKRTSPVAYPIGMIPTKSPRFKTMSESFPSPKESSAGENSKGDESKMRPPAIEKPISTSWETTAKNNKVKMPSNIPQAPSDKKDMFRSAYTAWQQAGLMKDVRDDSDSKREQFVPSSRGLKAVTERRDSVSDERLPKSTQALRSNDVIQYYKAWQRAGLMKKNPRMKSKMKLPTQQSESASVKTTRTERNASGVVKKAPDTNGNPYRVWQKVGLMKSGRPDKENHFWKSTPSSTNVPDLREQTDGGAMPTGEKSKPMPLPLAPSKAINARKAPEREHFKRTLSEESEDQDEFTNILNHVRHRSGRKEKNPLDLRQDDDSLKKFQVKKTRDGDSVSSHHRRIGGLSIQTASDNGSTVDFFDQMREQLSPRENVRGSPMSSGRVQNTFGTDVVYPKSPANSSSIFRASDIQAGENKGFEATIRNGKEKLHSWEVRTPENRNRPKPNHFQEICKSLESSDATQGSTLANLGGNRAIVLLERDSRYEMLVGQTNQSSNHQELVLQNLEVIASEKTMEPDAGCDGTCQCSQSIFSGNDNLIDFFLPQMGMACTCGQQSWVCANPDDPTAIENVLRPWQVKFLHRFGITHAEELVKARHRSVGILGKAMRQWRMKEGMQAFRTSSCIMALDIWSKTCKAYVRSVRKQLGNTGGSHGTKESHRALVPEISKFLMENPSTPQKSFETILS